MKGKRKVLIITNKVDAHTDLVIDTLKKRKMEFVRFNTEDFPINIELTFDSESEDLNIHCLDSGQRIRTSEVKSVWYRRPESCKIDESVNDEAFRQFAYQESSAVIQGVYNSINALWINHPLNIKKARSKIYQLKIAKKIGFNIPKTIITNVSKEALAFYKLCQGNVITKTLNIPTIDRGQDRFFTIFTSPVSVKDMENIKSVKYAPTLFQEYIPKKVEIRATVFGNKIFAAEIHSQQNPVTKDDWRHYNADINYFPHILPEKIEQFCFELVHGFGLIFGAIDMILTPQGKYVFLELNPNGQWIWIEQLTGLPMINALVDLLEKGKS